MDQRSTQCARLVCAVHYVQRARSCAPHQKRQASRWNHGLCSVCWPLARLLRLSRLRRHPQQCWAPRPCQGLSLGCSPPHSDTGHHGHSYTTQLQLHLTGGVCAWLTCHVSTVPFVYPNRPSLMLVLCAIGQSMAKCGTMSFCWPGSGGSMPNETPAKYHKVYSPCRATAFSPASLGAKTGLLITSRVSMMRVDRLGVCTSSVVTFPTPRQQ